MTVALTVVHFHLCTVSPSAAVDMADTIDYREGCWGSEIMFMSLTSLKIKCVFANVSCHEDTIYTIITLWLPLYQRLIAKSYHI